MRFALLGPLDVRDGSAVVALGGPKPRALMTALLLRANEPVSAEGLAAALWGEEVPRDLVGTVRQHVSRLRRVLPDGVLETTPAGYRLVVRPGELDAERFRTLVAEARASERPEDVAARLREALAEWRGSAVAEFAHEPFARDAAAELEELRLTALEARIDAELSLGKATALVGELRALVNAHPLRERLHAQLMLALYRSGRQAEALDAFRRVRSALVEELGIEPGMRLRELERAILNQDRALDHPSGQRASAAAPLTTRHEDAISLPPPLARETGHGPFVGRDGPLGMLRARWALAAAGERQFVLVVGEPGIGKTRLAAEFGGELHSAGVAVLYGRSDAEALVPYQSLIGALGPYVEKRAPQLLAEHEPDLRELARFLPGLQRHVRPQALPGDDPQAQRFRLHEAIARVTAAAARERPVALILDDLHWADAATALALSHLLAASGASPLLVVGIARGREDPWPTALEELGARQRGDPAFERIELAGLDAVATGALAGREADALASRLWERTSGNPLFIREMVRSGTDLDRTLSDRAVPVGIKEAIGRRIAKLGDTTARVLAVAAVEGREFRFEVLEQVLEDGSDAIVAAVEEAVAAGIVREIDDHASRLIFTHALVQDSLYEQQSGLRRRQAHARLGAALAAIGDQQADVARHLYIARDPESVRHSILAAQEAMNALAYEQAAEHYRHALERLHGSDTRERCELLIALAKAQRAAGDPGARATYRRVAELARGASAIDLLSQAADGLPYAYTEGGQLDHEAVALLEEALAALGERDDPLVVALLVRLASVLPYHDQPRVDALSARALDMARRIGDLDALMRAVESRHNAKVHISELDERIALAEELLVLARRHGGPELEGIAQFRRTWDLLAAGDLAGARSAQRELSGIAARLQVPTLLFEATCFDAVWAQIEDRLEDAWALAGRAAEIGERAQLPSAPAEHAGLVIALLHRQGRLGEHVDVIAGYVRALPHLIPYRAVLCLAHADAGQLEQARADFEYLAADRFAIMPRDVLWFSVMAVLAEVCGSLEEVEHAAVLYDELLPYRERFVQVAAAACWGSAEYYLGVLAATFGNAELAREHLRIAVERNTAAGLTDRAQRARDACDRLAQTVE